jgi:hypothetical protein
MREMRPPVLKPRRQCQVCAQLRRVFVDADAGPVRREVDAHAARLLDRD